MEMKQNDVGPSNPNTRPKSSPTRRSKNNDDY